MDSETVPERPDDLEINDILRMLPHRYPMLMVDRVTDVIPGVRATGIKAVNAHEPYFMGHFPQQAIMPGVMIIESMAQTAAVLVVRTLGAELEGRLVYFMSIEQARFRKPVVPGDRLEVSVEALQHRGPVWKFKGVGKVDGTVVAEATYSAMIVDEQ